MVLVPRGAEAVPEACLRNKLPSKQGASRGPWFRPPRSIPLVTQEEPRATGTQVTPKGGQMQNDLQCPHRAQNYFSTVSISQSIHMLFHALTGC